jgi:hypothetical protein
MALTRSSSDLSRVIVSKFQVSQSALYGSQFKASASYDARIGNR